MFSKKVLAIIERDGIQLMPDDVELKELLTVYRRYLAIREFVVAGGMNTDRSVQSFDILDKLVEVYNLECNIEQFETLLDELQSEES